jgi:hypothetical protein
VLEPGGGFVRGGSFVLLIHLGAVGQGEGFNPPPGSSTERCRAFFSDRLDFGLNMLTDNDS